MGGDIVTLLAERGKTFTGAYDSRRVSQTFHVNGNQGVSQIAVSVAAFQLKQSVSGDSRQRRA